MNEINKNKENTKTETETGTRIEKKAEREAKPRNGSPIKKPCTTIALSGTASEQSAAEPINATVAMTGAGNGGKPNPIRLVPLYLIPQAVSREIQTHKGRISEIVIRRTARHDYAITLTTRSPRAGPSPKAGSSPQSGPSPRGEPHAD